MTTGRTLLWLSYKMSVSFPFWLRILPRARWPRPSTTQFVRAVNAEPDCKWAQTHVACGKIHRPQEVSAYPIECAAVMLGQEILDIYDGEERMDVVKVRSHQVIAYLGLWEHERAFDAQVFQVVGVERGADAVGEEIVPALVLALRLAYMCERADARGVSWGTGTVVNLSPAQKGNPPGGGGEVSIL